MGMVRSVLLAETVLVLLVLLPQSRAPTYVSSANHPAYPGQCCVEQSGTAVEEGCTWNMPYCAQAVCGRLSDNDMIISFISCEVTGVMPGCIIDRQKSKPYPDCCWRQFCPVFCHGPKCTTSIMEF
ncbi:uncharacterized protein LOC127002175 [Eriocheir sinensis]|uniref:uncharacterized protein LOC127002175 n=1 Tax=Eriocheir sinensis TaxID=95602 RepID=UPI0021CAB817|nr:uncharacterized protein LOC127002175 [Eriocheir sinensis]